jgi:hypothetical protein
LLESLDYEEDFIVSEAWRQEIQKRCKEIDTNPSLLIDGEPFMTELKQRFFMKSFLHPQAQAK